MWDDIKAARRDEDVPQGDRRPALQVPRACSTSPRRRTRSCAGCGSPAGSSPSYQFGGVADVAETYGGGYADVTTRANLQIREITADDAVDVLDGAARAGHHQPRLRGRQHPQRHRQPDRGHRPAGADRHPAAGPGDAPLHPQPPRDVRPAAQVQHRLRRRRRDRQPGGHQRHRLQRRPRRRGHGRRRPARRASTSGCTLGGITGHKDFARDTGVLLTPEECVPVAAAVVRVFIENGDRTDRKKARLKYVLDPGASTKFVDETEKELRSSRSAGSRWTDCEPPAADRPHGPRRRSTRRSSRACSTSASCCRSAG